MTDFVLTQKSRHIYYAGRRRRCRYLDSLIVQIEETHEARHNDDDDDHDRSNIKYLNWSPWLAWLVPLKYMGGCDGRLVVVG